MESFRNAFKKWVLYGKSKASMRLEKIQFPSIVYFTHLILEIQKQLTSSIFFPSLMGF